MKKAFTLAEVLVTLVVIGVIAAISIPVINSILPNPDTKTYQKALYTLQGGVLKVMQEPEATISQDYLTDKDYPNSGFCDGLSKAINTSGKVNCTRPSSYENPNFVSTDGIRYWGLEGKNFNGTDDKGKKVRTVYVDRQLSKGELKTIQKRRDANHTAPGMKILVTFDGKVKTGTDTSWNYENNIIKNFIEK